MLGGGRGVPGVGVPGVVGRGSTQPVHPGLGNIGDSGVYGAVWRSGHSRAPSEPLRTPLPWSQPLGLRSQVSGLRSQVSDSQILRFSDSQYLNLRVS